MFSRLIGLIRMILIYIRVRVNNEKKGGKNGATHMGWPFVVI